MADPRPPHAYVVLVHRSPAQVRRLLARIIGERSWAFVHVDARAPQAVFDEIAADVAGREHVVMVDRRPVLWGGWGIVEAIYSGLEATLAAGPRFSHVAVVSGQDYPLRSPGAISDFLDAHPGWSFMTCETLPNEYYGQNGGVDRVTQWHRPVRGRRVRVPLWRRRFPEGLRPLVGSAWFCLSHDAVQYAVDFRARRPDAVRYFRHVWAPDEHYMQSVLASGDFPGRLSRENLWYMEWTPPSPKHPEVLTADAFDRLARAATPGDPIAPAQAKLWARKFDLEHHGDVLDRIDRELLAG